MVSMSEFFLGCLVNDVRDNLESNIYQKLENKDKSLAADVIKQWKRYIDDCFVFLERSFEDLQTFATILNSMHKNITFKMTLSEYDLPCLDI